MPAAPTSWRTSSARATATASRSSRPRASTPASTCCASARRWRRSASRSGRARRSTRRRRRSSRRRRRWRGEPIGGFRVLIAYRRDVGSIFLYGFAKSERDNVDDDELETTRDIAKGWLAASADQMARALADGLIHEVDHDEGTEQGLADWPRRY